MMLSAPYWVSGNDTVPSWIFDTLRLISLRISPLHRSHSRKLLHALAIRGRRSPRVPRPSSAACASRNRYNMDCAFSSLRAWYSVSILHEKQKCSTPFLLNDDGTEQVCEERCHVTSQIVAQKSRQHSADHIFSPDMCTMLYFGWCMAEYSSLSYHTDDAKYYRRRRRYAYVLRKMYIRCILR